MYIGKHSTRDLNDGYLGSFRDKDFKPESRIILGYYKTKEACVQAEIQWQRSLHVVEDSDYANRAYQTSDGFVNPGGWKHTEESKQKISKSMKGKSKPESMRQKRKALVGELAPAYGHRHSEETRAKMRAAHARRRGLPPAA